MKLEDARRVLGLRHLEDADAAGRIVGQDERRAASLASSVVPALEAGKNTALRDEALERRAHRLTRDPRIEAGLQAVIGASARPIRGYWVVTGIIVMAGVLGLATHVVGSDKIINLLSIPLLGLVAWNLFVYALVAWAILRGKGAAEVHRHGPTQWLDRILLRTAGVHWNETAPPPLPTAQAVDDTAAEPPSPGVQRVETEARRRFWEKWLPVVRHESTAWSELGFHSGSIALAAGMVFGMYVRGLAFEYTAAWQSTFLEPPAVSTVLRTALGPAAALLREDIPDAAGMQRLNIHDQEQLDPHDRESAAKWIHLYALTVLIFIGLPRSVMAFAAWRTLQTMRVKAPVEKDLDDTLQRLARQALGQELGIALVPFNVDLSPARSEAARQLLHRVWPAAGRVDFHAPVAYGDEDDWLDGVDFSAEPARGRTSLPPRLALVMSLSATPENEVHGELLRALQERVPVSTEETGLVLLLDTEPFRAQFDTLPEFERRLRERRAAWDRLVDGTMSAAFSEESGFLVWRRVGK